MLNGESDRGWMADLNGTLICFSDVHHDVWSMVNNTLMVIYSCYSKCKCPYCSNITLWAVGLWVYLFELISSLAYCIVEWLRMACGCFMMFSLLIRQYWSDPFRRSRRQDVKYGNPIRQCRGFNSNGKIHNLQPPWLSSLLLLPLFLH